MIELRVLGPVGLRTSAGTELRAVLAQPRRLALLAYLALRSSSGPQRRDTLLALFWPEADTAHGRGALRGAVHFLRHGLGAEAIVADSGETLHLDLERVWCDAVLFEQLLDSGKREDALRLYRGDLLEGFFISEAPEFDDWLEAERARLRRRAVNAAWELVDEAEAAGEVALASSRARAATLLQPFDDGGVRRLMALLARAGERALALEVYEAFVERMSRVYELEPAVETQALALEIRQGAGAPVGPARAASFEHSQALEPSAGDTTENAAAAKPGRIAASARRRHRLLASLVACVTLVAIGGVTLLAMRGRSPPVAVSDDVIAIFPFNYSGSAELAFMGEGIVSLVATSLDGAGDFRSVDPRALVGTLERRAERTPITPAVAARVAAGYGAGSYVLGEIVGVGGRMRIAATVYRSAEGLRSAPRQLSVEGRSEDLLSVVDRLTAGILELSSKSGLARVATRTTFSIPALRAYLGGESLMRRGEYRAALAAFQRAEAEDSSFALASYRVSGAAQWSGNPELIFAAAARALARVAGLTEEDRFAVGAWHAHVFEQPALAENMYRRLLARRPDRVEAWAELGELVFHWGFTLGHAVSDARLPFDRVLAIEPDHAAALIHLARIAAIEGKRDELERIVERALLRAPDDAWAVDLRVIRAMAMPDSAARLRAFASAIAAVGDPLDHLIRHAYSARDPNAAIQLLRSLLDEAGPTATVERGVVLLANLETALGRRRDALRTLDQAPIAEWRKRLVRAAWASHPALRVPEGERRALREALGPAFSRDSAAESGPAVDRYVDGIIRLRPYLRGQLSAALADTAAALAEAQALHPPDTSEYRNADRAITIRARLALGGSPGTAELQELLAMPVLAARHGFQWESDYDIADQRFARAEILERLGRLREALQWYATIPSETSADVLYLAPAHFARARIHERLGERDDAAGHYERFLELWADADAELQPDVSHARHRLALLKPRSDARR
jgi:DNA-binding SARP family transcriptional activator/tetratricopeptide (TPR) repeat protein